MPTPLGVSSAPPRPPKPRPGEDALSTVLATSPSEMVDAERRVLEALKGSESPMSIKELCSELMLDFISLSVYLVDLHQKNEIAIAGSPGNERVSIVPKPV
jgi:hypothetical protein